MLFGQTVELRNYITLHRNKTTAYNQLEAEMSSIVSTPIIGELTGEIGYIFSISRINPMATEKIILQF